MVSSTSLPGCWACCWHIMVGGCVGGNNERQEAGQSGSQFLPLGGCAQWPNFLPSGQYSNDFTTLQKHQELKTKPSPQVPSRDVQNLCHSHQVIFPGTGTSPCQQACVWYCHECTKVRATALSKPKSHWPLPPVFPWEYKTFPQYFYAFPGETFTLTINTPLGLQLCSFSHPDADVSLPHTGVSPCPLPQCRCVSTQCECVSSPLQVCLHPMQVFLHLM